MSNSFFINISSIASVLVLLLASAQQAEAQPLKENLPRPHRAAPDSDRTVTMDDFRYRSSTVARDGSAAPWQLMQQKAGVAMLGSALIPGLGQAANRKWIRAGAYLAADALLLAVHFTSLNQARDRERRYEQFANSNWSVVTYAQWLVDYNEQNNIPNPRIDELRQQVEGVNPAYNPEEDWRIVDIELLRAVERETLYFSPDGPGNPFSHVLPDYGSQQYYELISKYYQYGPGWNDFGQDRTGGSLDDLYLLAWDGSDMPFNFFQGADLAERFNDKYRLAGNMVSLLVLNHVVSAFDALFTVRFNNSRMETETNLFKARQFTLRYHF